MIDLGREGPEAVGHFDLVIVRRTNGCIEHGKWPGAGFGITRRRSCYRA